MLQSAEYELVGEVANGWLADACAKQNGAISVGSCRKGRSVANVVSLVMWI